MPCVYSQCWCWQRYKHWQLSCVRREVIRSTKNIELFQSWALGVCHVIWLTDINLKGVESNFTAQWAKQKLKWVLASLPLPHVFLDQWFLDLINLRRPAHSRVPMILSLVVTVMSAWLKMTVLLFVMRRPQQHFGDVVGDTQTAVVWCAMSAWFLKIC